MENSNQNQRIIFDLPEDTTPGQTILDILEKNGIDKPGDDLTDTTKTPKLVTVNRAAKKFFDKKITEEEMSQLFQKEIGVSKEAANGIINNIKTRLIPFGKKITIPANNEQTVDANDIEKLPMGIEKTLKKREFMKKSAVPEDQSPIDVPTRKNAKITLDAKPKIKKITEDKKIQNPSPIIKQNRGPDNYREPIE